MVFCMIAKEKGSDPNGSLPFGVNYGSLFEPQRLFHYFPIRGVGGVGGTETVVVDVLEGLLGHKETLEVRRVELQLDILSLRRRRDIEVIAALVIVLRSRDTAAVAADKGREDAFGLREGYFDHRCHRGSHIVLHRDDPIGIRSITRVNIRIGVLAACESTEYRAQNTDR